MPSCIVAFHVTCAFDHGLEMRTILAENDEVRFKSFCLEHSSSTAKGGSVSNGIHAAAAAAAATNGSNGAARPDLATAPEDSELRADPGLRPNGNGSCGGDGEQRSAMSASERAERDQLEREKVSQRKQKLQELEDEFYRLVEPREVAENLALPTVQVLQARSTRTHAQSHIRLIVDFKINLLLQTAVSQS